MNLALLLVTASISASTAWEQIFYVLPDNSTNTSCLFQPCATLSQYLLDNNGSLPVVSNVEYHFLPGEHYVPTDMFLQHLHNVTMTGYQSSFSISSSVIISSLQSYIQVSDSINVSIKGLVFKKHGVIKTFSNDYNLDLYNLAYENCFSCKLLNVKFQEYGFYGENLRGKSYLNDIIIHLIELPLCCYSGIRILYFPAEFPGGESKLVNEQNLLVMNRISISSINDYEFYLKYGVGISIQLPKEIKFLNTLTIIISNSYFYHMRRMILYIISDECATNATIKVYDCVFSKNFDFEMLEMQSTMVRAKVSQFNVTLFFINCTFIDNYKLPLLSIETHKINNWCFNSSYASASSVVITNCSFFNNDDTLLSFLNTEPLTCVNVHITGPVYILENHIAETLSELIHINNSFVHINGTMYISKSFANSVISIFSSHIFFSGLIEVSNNTVQTVLMHFQSSYVTFNGPVTISENVGSVIRTQSCNVTLNGPITISMNTNCDYIMLLQYSEVLFNKHVLFMSNMCYQIIVLKAHKDAAYFKVMEYSNITFLENNSSDLIAIKVDSDQYNFHPFCLFQYVTLQNTSVVLPSHYTVIITDDFLYKCKFSFYHSFSHCKWMSTAAFYGQKAEVINQQIIQLDNDISQSKHHTTIFYCSNFSADKIGPVYPGQKLQVELCTPCSDKDSILYAETNNVQLPKSACKIAHQTQLVNFITNNSTMVIYTIVSEANNSCELFLTVSPFLYEIYEVFDVQLLPCPIGFTLQNGVCKCDPLLPTGIDTCYIDQSAIRRPANTWISYTQSGNSKYLISDCPMDYCLPFSSNVNLLHPDTQCQFNRSGILCSQCQPSLSMVFGSSRCIKCTNVHLLISIVIIVVGIVLVVFLYLLNLTVTKATISGIILYANIISINYSVFLINDKVFTPLRVFISFTNLDLGIEACFYNAMDSYVKILLHLFFPTFLIFMAFTIIITSRYSSRILRLTYSRSLPVLATLFLLSYTSVLRTVLTVLFSYSTITHAPSSHQELVWSVDASVPLFGLKFIILFITCLVLFLILLFFNIILLFTRYLLQFKLINYFKPILDAFQGSYKDRCYYWVAVHIILRSLFFALYAFQTELRLLLATVILVLFTSIFGYICPNKNKLINFQELLILINLTIMHAVSYYSNDSVFGIVTNLMISLAFMQFCLIVIYHFITYTCHYNIENTLGSARKKLVDCFTKDSHTVRIAINLLDIPERTYNYSEYQDGLVSDDFAVHRQ